MEKVYVVTNLDRGNVLSVWHDRDKAQQWAKSNVGDLESVSKRSILTFVYGRDKSLLITETFVRDVV